MEETKQRVVQEFVPGKQVTLAHIVANPDPQLFAKLGLGKDLHGAIAILTITPSEASIIAADAATKASEVQLGFVDRFSGSLLIVGSLADVEAGLRAVLDTLVGLLHFTPAPITRS